MFLTKRYFCLLNFDLNIFINNFTIINIYINNLLTVNVNRKFDNIIKKTLAS